MNQADILENAVTVEEYSLRQLQTWLQYEKYTWFLGAGAVWVPYSLIVMGLAILAVLFYSIYALAFL